MMVNFCHFVMSLQKNDNIRLIPVTKNNDKTIATKRKKSQALTSGQKYFDPLVLFRSLPLLIVMAPHNNDIKLGFVISDLLCRYVAPP